MILLSRSFTQNNKRHSHIVTLFGTGLIGFQVLESLKRSKDWDVEMIPYSWEDAKKRAKELTLLNDTIKIRLAETEPDERQLDFVWCAGKAGFSSEPSVFEAEHSVFVQTYDTCASIVKTNEFTTSKCHMVSSAGGLFEGQTFVDQHSKPQPLRPYGDAKMRLETFISKPENILTPYIYRPSSVYGYNNSKSRIGLIVALLGNSIRNVESVIYGKPSTLRDFVFADDIGKFIAEKILNIKNEAGIFTLAAGKPASMYEIITLIQSIERKNLFLRYSDKSTNISDNTFNPAGQPRGWHPTPLKIGVSQVSQRMKTRLHT